MSSGRVCRQWRRPFSRKRKSATVGTENTTMSCPKCHADCEQQRRAHRTVWALWATLCVPSHLGSYDDFISESFNYPLYSVSFAGLSHIQESRGSCCCSAYRACHRVKLIQAQPAPWLSCQGLRYCPKRQIPADQYCLVMVSDGKGGRSQIIGYLTTQNCCSE